MQTDAYVTKVYQKGLYAHSFKTHFPSSFDSYVNKPTVHVCNKAKS